MRDKHRGTTLVREQITTGGPGNPGALPVEEDGPAPDFNAGDAAVGDLFETACGRPRRGAGGPGVVVDHDSAPEDELPADIGGRAAHGVARPGPAEVAPRRDEGD